MLTKLTISLQHSKKSLASDIPSSDESAHEDGDAPIDEDKYNPIGKDGRVKPVPKPEGQPLLEGRYEKVSR
jgi:hypothetical protein